MLLGSKRGSLVAVANYQGHLVQSNTPTLLSFCVIYSTYQQMDDMLSGENESLRVIDRVACVSCGLIIEGSFVVSLSTLAELRSTSDCCNFPNYIFYRGLDYHYKETFKKKVIERNPNGRIA